MKSFLATVLLANLLIQALGAAPAAVQPNPYGVDPQASEREVMEAYARWHTETLEGDCSTALALTWSATAGFGDSVNALLAAVRVAVHTGRLLFIDWNPTNDLLLDPDFQWRLTPFLVEHPTRCGIAKEKGGERDQTRSAHITGHIHTGHPLLKSEPFPYSYLRVGGAATRSFLLRPSKGVTARVDAMLAQLHHGTAPIIGAQVRTGNADRSAKDAPIPSHAIFLSPGDEELFIEQITALLKGHFKIADDAIRPSSADALPAVSPRIFLMTDSRDVEKKFEAAFGARALTMEGPVTQTAPWGFQYSQNQDSLTKALADWFTFCKVDFAYITSWSLYGSTATAHLEEIYDPKLPRLINVDDSRCGEPGRRPCRNEKPKAEAAAGKKKVKRRQPVHDDEL